MKRIFERILTLVLICAMLLPSMTVSYATDGSTGDGAGEVLFFSDFEDRNLSSLAGLEDEELAEAIFGEGNYILGHADRDASLRIEDGGLRIIGDNNQAPGDGRRRTTAPRSCWPAMKRFRNRAL